MASISFKGKDKNNKDMWLVRVFMGFDQSGKRITHSHVVHGGRRDAEKYGRQVEGEKDNQTFIEPSRQTVQQYLDEWLEQHAKKKVEPRTFNDYVDFMNRHVYPRIGSAKLSKVQTQPLLFRKLLNEIEDGDGTVQRSRTAQYIHMILKQALKDAVKWGIIAKNPMELIPRPKNTRKREIHPLTIEESHRFLDAAMYDQYFPLYALMIDTGVRPSEALALQWSDVDLKAGKIHIKHSLARDKDGWRLKPPKNKHSRRTIPLAGGTTEILREYRKERPAKLIHDRTKEFDFVFTTANGQPLDLHNLRRRNFKPILEHAGLPSTVILYDLRHTCATLLLLAGENPKIVSERLGHSSIRMTLDTYSHVIPAMQESAATKLDSMLYKDAK